MVMMVLQSVRSISTVSESSCVRFPKTTTAVRSWKVFLWKVIWQNILRLVHSLRQSNKKASIQCSTSYDGWLVCHVNLVVFEQSCWFITLPLHLLSLISKDKTTTKKRTKKKTKERHIHVSLVNSPTRWTHLNQRSVSCHFKEQLSSLLHHLTSPWLWEGRDRRIKTAWAYFPLFTHRLHSLPIPSTPQPSPRTHCLYHPLWFTSQTCLWKY